MIKRIIKTVIPWLFIAVLCSTTACSPNEELTIPETKVPVPNPENPDTPDNPGHQDNENDEKNDDIMNKEITIRVGDRSFAATLENNKAGKAFAALLPMTVTMSELNGNEKYHYLSKDLPTDSSRPETIRNGDLMLYGSNCLVLFYETLSSSYSYTRIGRVTHPDGLSSALGSGNATLTFEINKNQYSQIPHSLCN